MNKEILHNSCKDLFIEIAQNSDPLKEISSRNINDIFITGTDLKNFLVKHNRDYDDLVVNRFISTHTDDYQDFLDSSLAKKVPQKMTFDEFLKLIDENLIPQKENEDNDIRSLFEAFVQD